MHRDETIQARRPSRRRATSAALARFESWLRSQGYQTECDPFIPNPSPSPSPDDCVAKLRAVMLVSEYVSQRPNEMAYRNGLLKHAWRTGSIEPIWGDSGCGHASEASRE